MDKVLNSLTERIVVNLVNNNKIEIEKAQLYQYSALITIQSTMNILTSLFLGLIFGRFVENLFFFTSYKIIRKYSGGFHANKFSVCYFVSIISNIVILLAIELLSYYPNYLLVLIFELVSFAVVIIFAPVVNENKSISTKEKLVYKIMVCSLYLVMLILSIIFAIKCCEYIFAIGLSLSLNSLFIGVELIRRKCVGSNYS